MKQKITLFIMMLGLSINTKAQVTLSEDFNAPFTLNAANGWTVQNNSSPTGTLSWFQGNSNVFGAYNGTNTTDYFAANFNSASGTGDISNWLISPTVTLVNGATIQFATRTVSATTVFPDRLEVRVSSTGANTIGVGATTVSSYSLVFSVNPNLSTSSSSSIPTSSTVATYPQNWTVYTATLSNITNTVNGRIAFRYFVTSGGPNGANSSYIGLDAVRYTLPCQQPSLSIASTNSNICGGSTVSLTVSNPGTLAANSYTWNNGTTNTTNIVSPTVTSTYTVYGTSSSGCIGSATAAITVSASPIVQLPSYTVCPGTSLTLLASGNATSFAWNGGATSTLNSIAISPTATTVYTVTGIGTNTGCPTTQTSTITIGTQLSVLINSSANSICTGGSVTLTALSAASIYSWSTGSTSASITITPSASAVYTVAALNGTTCFGAETIAITVNSNPTLSVIMSPSSNICSNATINVSASGANSYNYILGPNFVTSVNPVNLIAPTSTVLVNSQFTLVGTTAQGCSSSSIYTFAVNPNPVFVVSPANPLVCINQSITLSASGASSYSWTGPTSSTGNNVSYSAGNTPTNVAYSVVGTGTNGCTSTQNINLTVSNCVGLNSNQSNLVAIYPNPFTSEINLKGLNGSVQIFNLIGEMILSQRVNESDVIKTNALPQGIYILKLIGSNNETETLRIIKN